MSQNLTSYLEAVEPAYQMCRTSALSILGSLGVSMTLFSFIRSAIVPHGESAISWFIRLFVVVMALSSFSVFFPAMVQASLDLTEYFNKMANWDVIYQGLTFIADQTTGKDKMGIREFLGLMQGSLLSILASVSYFLIILAFDSIQTLSGVFLAILKVFAPLMFVGGILGSGASLMAWFHNVIQVLIWPVVPPIFLFLITSSHKSLMSQSENLSYVISQNIMLAALAFLTPAFVAVIVGSRGVGSVLKPVKSMTDGIVSSVASYAVSAFKKDDGQDSKNQKKPSTSQRPDDIKTSHGKKA